MDPEDQDNPAVPEAPAEPDQPTLEDAPEAAQPGTSDDDPPYFDDERFDPSTLDPQLQQAYKQMQGAWTKKTTELAEQRKQNERTLAWVASLQSDPDAQTAFFQQLAEQLGYELPEDDGQDEEIDVEDNPDEIRDPRVDELLAERERAREEQQLDELEQGITTQIADHAKQAGITELSDAEESAVFALALARPATDNGVDVAGAWALYQQVADAVQKRLIASKQAPTVAPHGVPAGEIPDTSTPEGRVAAMAHAAAAAMASG